MTKRKPVANLLATDHSARLSTCSLRITTLLCGGAMQVGKWAQRGQGPALGYMVSGTLQI